MPTKRTRRTHGRRSTVSDVVLYLLSDGLIKLPATTNVENARLEAFRFMWGEDRQRVWGQCEDFILPRFIKERPGTRPKMWWDCDAPEVCRKRLGGIGDVAWDHLAYKEQYGHGLPQLFVEEWSVEYYNGRQRDIHGNRIGTNYKEGHFTGKAIDPENPPMYESQAAYLERHGLLTASEKRALNPKDFEPEFVLDSCHPCASDSIIGKCGSETR